MIDSEQWDVVVAGAGAAGLCAALAARQAGAERVVVVDSGGADEIGGNARVSGGLFLFAHGGTADVGRIVDLDPAAVSVEPYSVAEYYDELMSMSGGIGDATLLQELSARSYETMVWLRELGVEFELAHAFGAFMSAGSLIVPPGPTLEAAGGGPGFIAAMVEAVRAAGIVVVTETPLERLVRGDGAIVPVTGGVEGGALSCGAVVVSTGGFAANPALRRKHLGEEWAHAKMRGTRHSTGDGILAAIEVGAAPAGDWSRCHAAAVDADAPSPETAGTTPTHLRGFWLGLIVNRLGERFIDEGADRWIKIYSRLGRAVLAQPGGEAFEIFDQKTAARVEELMVEALHSPATPIVAETIPELADAVGIPAASLARTIDTFNASLSDRPFDPDALDGKSTVGLDPPKSNWATPIDTPPYVAYRARCGITFTHGGVRTDAGARVLDDSASPIPGLYSAGEATGGFFYGDYPGGSSLMRSAVFGCAAGTNAAAFARRRAE